VVPVVDGFARQPAQRVVAKRRSDFHFAGRADRAAQAHARVVLPVCEECNGKLSQRFEDPAIDAVTKLATNRWCGTLSASEWQAERGVIEVDDATLDVVGVMR